MYIDRLLSSDEKLIYVTRRHWITFAPSITLLIAAFFAWCFLPDVIALREPVFRGWRFYQVISVTLLLAGRDSLMRCAIDYVTTFYAVTNRRVLMKSGWLVRRVIEVFVTRIEGISIRQGFIGQMFNYATVVVTGTGGTEDFYIDIPNPESFHRAVQAQMTQRRGD